MAPWKPLGQHLSQEIGREEIQDWPHTMWSRRYESIPVSAEPESFWESYSVFVAAFRDRTARFPPGFVPARVALGERLA